MRATVALLVSLALPFAAVAQETGTLRPIAPAGSDDDGKNNVRDTMRHFGRCALAKSPGFVAKLLDAPAGSPDYERWIRRVSDGDCLGYTGSLRFGVADMRGALFEASYVRFFSGSGPTDFAAVPPIDYAARYGQPGNGRAASAVALAGFADCVTRADGTDARAMIVAAPGSAAETTAIAGLRPHLAACVPQGTKLSFDRGAFRAGLAEGLYRLTQAATGKLPPVGGGS